jgi:hypothetical protein
MILGLFEQRTCHMISLLSNWLQLVATGCTTAVVYQLFKSETEQLQPKVQLQPVVVGLGCSLFAVVATEPSITTFGDEAVLSKPERSGCDPGRRRATSPRPNCLGTVCRGGDVQ